MKTFIVTLTREVEDINAESAKEKVIYEARNGLLSEDDFEVIEN